MKRTSVFALAGTFAALAVTSQSANAQTTPTEAPQNKTSSSAASFRLGTGISYSKGSYGEIEDTKVIAVPVSLTYKKDGFKIRVSVPWVRIDGPGSLIQTPEGRDGGGGFDDGGGSNSGSGSSNSGSGSSGSSGSGSSGSGSGGGIEVEDGSDDDLIDDDGITGNNGVGLVNNKRSGFGDVNVAMTYSVGLGSGFYFDPAVKVKLPTASKTKRLGTGKFDFTLSGDLVKDVGNASFYLHGRRKFAGKSAGSTIRSTWGAGGGASVKAGKGFTVGADYGWQQSAFIGRKASSEVTGWANARLSDRASFTVFAGTGLNANSADFSGGASISYRF
jgi:hypothetical protein